MKQKVALSLPGPEPTVDVQAAVTQAIAPLIRQLAELQTQVQQFAAIIKPPKTDATP